ncbi:MAG: histidine phosphatase family protein [Burkholderiaceae bacterium]
MSAHGSAASVTPPRRRIYLMRHGSVSYFGDDGRPLGDEEVPLNERGIAQAQAAGRLFAAHDVRFDRVVTSGLPRTTQTAEAVLRAAGQSLAPMERPQLREMRRGDLEGLRDEELRSAFLGALDGIPPDDARFMGGETVGELIGRVLPEIEALRADPGWQCALLVLHGVVNRVVLSYALTGRPMLLGGLLQSPACINALDVGSEPRDWIVRYVNLFADDLIQRDARASTMEQLLDQYLKWRTRD